MSAPTRVGAAAQPAARRRTPVLLALLCAVAAVRGVAVALHEPWRDELQA